MNALDGGSRTYNLVSGQGLSIMEVVEAAHPITGHASPYEIVARRDDEQRFDVEWEPQYPDL